MSTSVSRFNLANRLEHVGFSDIVNIRNKILELRSTGLQVFQFEGGEPLGETPSTIKEAMCAALVENRTRYAPSSGIPELRQAIAEKLCARNGIRASMDEVIVLNGGMQGLFAAFQAVVNPGDEVIVFSPYWTPIKDLISHCEGVPVLVQTEKALREGLYGMLENTLSDRTRAIYFNSPQNPTGFVFDRKSASEVATFAQDHDLVVIADEAYEDLVYEGEHFSIGSLEGMNERTITCYTFSKSYSMTGWRLGYAVAEEPWMTGMRKALLYSTNGVSTPTQWAGLAALSMDSSYRRATLDAYRQRRNLMVKGLNDLGLKCSSPGGAFYAFPDVSAINSDSRQAADILLRRARVATVPGAVFGPHGENHLRFSYSTSIENIEGGLESLRTNL